MVQAFDIRVRELKGVMSLRTPTPDDDLAECLSQLAQSLSAVERGFDALQGAVQAEKQSLPHAETIAAKVDEQSELLRRVAANLPQQLPGASCTTTDEQTPSASGSMPLSARTNSPVMGGKGGKVAKKKTKSSARPHSARAYTRLEYVTKDQLDAAPAYTKGRLTIDKVNAGVDDLRELLRIKYEICAADRRKKASLSRGDGKRVALWRTQARAAETQGFSTFFSEVVVPPYPISNCSREKHARRLAARLTVLCAAFLSGRSDRSAPGRCLACTGAPPPRPPQAPLCRHPPARGCVF